jgi:hypothetical protein
MARPNHPDAILHTRTVLAQDVVEGRADLRSYPFRHLAVLAHRGQAIDQVPAVMVAVEMLGAVGWELVNVAELAQSRSVSAFVRRHP